MQNPVYTAKGVLERAELELKLVFTEQQGSMAVAAEWWEKSTGVLVRRDAWVNLFISQTIGGEQAKIN